MMKRTKWILTIGLIIFASYPFINTQAQLKNLGAFMAAGQSDAQKLFVAYLSPYLNAFGASMTGGWYNTAKPHKLGGVDLTFTFNTAIVPKNSRTFDIDALGLQSLKRDPAANNLSPTVAGKRVDGSQLNYNFQDIGYTAKAFDLPKGTGFPMIPTPMLQLGVGLIKGTEIIGRWVPTVHSGQAQLGLWGIGLKHNIDQWIPGLKKLPVLNISVMGGYTKLNGKVGFTVDPADIGMDAYNSLPANTWDGQSLQLATSSFTANLLVSANLPVVCFFGGFGFATTKSNLKLNGNFPVASVNATSFQPEVKAIKDPINFQVKNQDGGVTKPRVDLGMRIKLGVLTIHFDYTKANYSVATAGIGLSFR